MGQPTGLKETLEAQSREMAHAADFANGCAGGLVDGIDCSVAVDTCPRTTGPFTGNVLPYGMSNVLEHYSLGREIGRGSYGIVRECLEKSTGRTLACKVIQKRHLATLQDRKVVAREVGLMKMVRGHSCVVSLEGVFESEEEVVMVMEFCNGGELYHHILSHGRFPEAEAAVVFSQIVDAIQFCHSQGVVHRDLKPENILFHHRVIPSSEENQEEAFALDVKLADFGLGTWLSRDECARARIGSLMYEAPEVVCGSEYDEKADVWSLGVILHALLSGTLPFIDADQQRLAKKICAGAYELRFSPWPFVSNEAKALVRKLIVVDPRRRPSAAEILTDPWLLRHLALPTTPERAKGSPVVHHRSASSPELCDAASVASNHTKNEVEGSIGIVLSRSRDAVDVVREEDDGNEIQEESDSFWECGGVGEEIFSRQGSYMSASSGFTVSSLGARIDKKFGQKQRKGQKRGHRRQFLCCGLPEFDFDWLSCMFKPDGTTTPTESHGDTKLATGDTQEKCLLSPESKCHQLLPCLQKQQPLQQDIDARKPKGQHKDLYFQVGDDTESYPSQHKRGRRFRRFLAGGRNANRM